MDAFFLTSRLTRLYGEIVSSKMYLSSVPNLMQIRGRSHIQIDYFVETNVKQRRPEQ